MFVQCLFKKSAEMKKDMETLSVFDRKVINNITLAVVCDRRRPAAKDVGDNRTTYYIKIRVTYGRESNYLRLGDMKCTLETWEADICNKTCRKNDILDKIRPELKAQLKKAETITKDLSARKCFTYEKLRESFFAVTIKVDDESNVIKLIETKIAALRQLDKYNTATTYESTLKALKAFRGDSIAVGAIDLNWLIKFEKFLENNGRNETTIGFYMRNLRCIVKGCIPEIIPAESFPFGKGKYQIPTGKGRNIALTKDELRRIRDYDDEQQAKTYYRDIWLFSFFCNGANMADICRFRYDQIKNGELSFSRHKTADRTKDKKVIYVTLDDEMRDIIERCGNKDKTGLIFPFLNGMTDEEKITKRIADVTRRVNLHMAKIGEALNLGHLNTYVARHSYASVAISEGVPLSYISQSLGHSNISTTDEYIDQFRPEERRKQHDKIKL